MGIWGWLPINGLSDYSRRFEYASSDVSGGKDDALKFFGPNMYLFLSRLYNPFAWLFLQMLCEERGFFLEIADLIKGLGLTILKGVMEAHNDKIWARFVVEVILHKNRTNPCHLNVSVLFDNSLKYMPVEFPGKQGRNEDGNIYVTRSSSGANDEGQCVFIQCHWWHVRLQLFTPEGLIVWNQSLVTWFLSSMDVLRAGSAMLAMTNIKSIFQDFRWSLTFSNCFCFTSHIWNHFEGEWVFR